MADPLAPTKPMPQRISVSSSACLLTVSLSLASFSLYFLSFRDTIFWFFLSNAIIFLIAAADSDAKHKPNIYEEYLKNIRSSRSVYLTPLPESKPLEKNGEESQSEDSKGTESSAQDPFPEEASSTATEEKKDPVMESCSEVTNKAIVAVEHSNGKMKEEEAMSRSDGEDGGSISDGGDFSALSNEELNKRAEEFIRRFNREIWLQEMRERKKLPQI